MQNPVLAVDVGKRRTGVAFLPAGLDVPLALPTLLHKTEAEFRDVLQALIRDRKPAVIVVGLPLLPSGAEGEQAALVRKWVGNLTLPEAATLLFIDERYTTPQRPEGDPNTEAALRLLQTYFDRQI